MHGVAGKAAGCCHLASGGNPCPAQELDPGGGEDSCGDDDGDDGDGGGGGGGEGVGGGFFTQITNPQGALSNWKRNGRVSLLVHS